MHYISPEGKHVCFAAETPTDADYKLAHVSKGGQFLSQHDMDRHPMSIECAEVAAHREAHTHYGVSNAALEILYIQWEDLSERVQSKHRAAVNAWALVHGKERV